MKIISLHVQDFGKLHDVKLPLNDGINVISNSNGFGKTTVASFIRAMLYGFTYRTANGVKDSARFAPWQGTGRFGGSIVVLHEGQTYRIERFFGVTQKQETLTVINVATGKALDLNEMQPGEYFLGLTADSYDRSAYFPQEAVSLASNDNFDSKLANLVENGADDYDKIQEKLRGYKKSIRYEKGNGGKIYELECRRRDLIVKQRDAERAKNRAAEIEKTLHEIEQEKQELLFLQQQRKHAQAELQRKVATAQPTPEQQVNAARLAELNNAISRIPSEFENDFETCENIANEIVNLKQDGTAKPRTKIVLIAGLAVFFGAFLAALGAVNILPNAFLYIGIVLAAVGAVGVFVELLSKRKFGKKSDVESKRNELISQYLELAKKYVFVDGAEFDTVKQNLWKAHSTYLADVRERDVLQNTIRVPQADSLKAESELEQANAAISDIERRLNGISMRIGELTTERKSLTFDCVAIEDELLNVEQEMEQAKFDYEVADTVSRLLGEAKDNLSTSYLPKLTARCEQLLCTITQGNYSVVVDRSFNLKIRVDGATRDMNEFSRGIREITLLCFRVALSELLYDGAIPFIIIADAFVNFDEDNFLRATRLLKQLSTCAQVVYFTCHDRTGELLK